MKSLITSGNGTAELIDTSDPVAGAGELLVVPIAAGVCGTDLEIISGDGDPAFVKYPASLGHEWVGRVIGHGAGVTSPAIGSRIVVTGIIPAATLKESVAKHDLHPATGPIYYGLAITISAPRQNNYERYIFRIILNIYLHPYARLHATAFVANSNPI